MSNTSIDFNIMKKHHAEGDGLSLGSQEHSSSSMSNSMKSED